MFNLFETTDPDSDLHWQNLAITAFKYSSILILCFIILFRLFDKNYDGYIDKKEFKWMTTSKIVSNRTIDIVFKVRTT